MDRTRLAKRLQRPDVEGRELHMYLCSGGKVTTGAGHAMLSVEDALSLPWMIGDRSATEEEVRAAYAKVAAAPLGYRASWYARLTLLRLPSPFVDELTLADIDGFTYRLSVQIPGFDLLPEPVQEALFDMGYNLGLAGLTKFKKLLAAVGRQDWHAAAAQCRRLGISEERNSETAQLFLEGISSGPKETT
jgi:GH24 family phage-related lysozyme (muramidase)